MSLASRISNLFSGYAIPDRAAQQHKLELGNTGDDGLSDEGVGRMHNTEAQSFSASSSETMAPENDEEEGRPPYLHVRCADSVGWG